MAPAASAFAFVTEFIGPIYTGLAALIDLPMKAYMLVFMRYVIRAKATSTGEKTGASGKSGNLGKQIFNQLTDPFNAAIIGGILCSLIFKGGAIAKMGFAGLALETMAAAQTPVLFLLIGLKVSIDGATPSLCGVLLLLRHGLLMLVMKTFFLVAGVASLKMQLLLVLASQAERDGRPGPDQRGEGEGRRGLLHGLRLRHHLHLLPDDDYSQYRRLRGWVCVHREYVPDRCSAHCMRGAPLHRLEG